MARWDRVDVVILTAIELEYAAVKLVDAGAAPGSRWIEETHDGLPVALRELVTSAGGHLRVLAARAANMGQAAAIARLVPLVEALRPSCVAMCGVCAGKPKKTNLGDVVVAERLFDYDTGKWTDFGFQADVRTYSLPDPWKIAAEQFDPRARFGAEDWWHRRPVPYEWQERWVLLKLHEGVGNPAALPEHEVHCPQWSTVIESLWEAELVERDTTVLTAQGQKRAAGLAIKYPKLPDLSPAGAFMPFKVHVQPIGSGSAVREDVDVWAFITQHMRSTLGLEMEAAALGHVVRARAHHDPIEAVVMKGVMDFANHGRDDHFKEYAARASAECLLAFLRDRLPGRPARVASVDRRGADPGPRSGFGADLGGCDPKAIYVRLLPPLSDQDFEEVLRLEGIDRAQVVSAGVSRADRSLAVSRLAEKDVELCRRLARLLDEAAARVAGPERPGDHCDHVALDHVALDHVALDHVALYDRLLRLTPLAFEEALLRGRVNRDHVSSARASLAERAIEVARLAEKDLELCRRLTRLLDELAAPSGGAPGAAGPGAAPAGAAERSAPSPVLLERLAGVKRELAGVVNARPAPFARLAALVGCAADPGALAEGLVSLRGSVATGHVLTVFDERPRTPDGDADREALRRVLCIVLPYVSDWRAEVEACCRRGKGQSDVVELSYRSDTIAEAIMAGWMGRECQFEYKPGTEPFGEGVVQIPAELQAPTFASTERLLGGVVDELTGRLEVGGLNAHERRLNVESMLKEERQRGGSARRRYYFLFRDAAWEEDPDSRWTLAQDALHREGGLPSLVLVRMKGSLDAHQSELNTRMTLLMRPRAPSQS